MPVAIIGYTGSGKSRMMREVILPQWRKRGVSALILDPVCQGWGARPPWAWQTADPYAYLEKAKASRRCVLVVDECKQHVGKSQKIANDLAYIPCVSRNHGHYVYLMGQRTFHLPPDYRSQCSEAFLFWQPELKEAIEAAIMAGLPSSWGHRIHQLPLGQCYHCRPREAPRLLKVF